MTAAGLNSRTIIGWEQTKSATGLLQGAKVYLDDDTSVDVGPQGPISEGVIYFPGPINGVRYKHGAMIESLQWIYDSCYCTGFTPSTNSVSALMG